MEPVGRKHVASEVFPGPTPSLEPKSHNALEMRQARPGPTEFGLDGLGFRV